MRAARIAFRCEIRCAAGPAAEKSRVHGSDGLALVDVPSWGFYAVPVTAAYEEPELVVPFGSSQFRLEVEPDIGVMRGHLGSAETVPVCAVRPS